MAAKGAEAGDDRVARLHRADFAAHRLDDPGGFMAGDGGQGVRIGAVDEVQVRMAKPAGGGADAHLVRTGLVDDNLLDDEGLAGFDQDGGFGQCIFSVRFERHREPVVAVRVSTSRDTNGRGTV